MSEVGTVQNEIGRGFIELTPQMGVISLPNMVASGAPPAQGQYIRPRHALINIEGGSIRYRCDGSDPTPTIGMLGRAGTDLDWTNPLIDFQALIVNCRIVAVSGTVVLNISYRD